MKYILMLVLSLTPLTVMANNPDQWKPRLMKACHSMIQRTVRAAKSSTLYCSCAVGHHLKDSGLNEERVSWLEKLYLNELKAAEIEADKFGIAEFEIEVEASCRKLRP